MPKNVPGPAGFPLLHPVWKNETRGIASLPTRGGIRFNPCRGVGGGWA